MDLLAIVAHPDDAGIFCGGTLAKHADRGDDVRIAHVTRGEYGGFEGTEAEVAETREAEAREAASVLGADCAFLGFDDGRVTASLENRLRFVEAIRRNEPDVVVTHYASDMHPDHRATSELVSDAYYMASLPLVETESEPHDPDNVYFFGKPTSGFEPRVYVDVGEYQDRKQRAIECHESQLAFLREHGGIDAEFDGLVDGIRAEALVFGKEAGVRFAEGFAPLHQPTTEYLR